MVGVALQSLVKNDDVVPIHSVGGKSLGSGGAVNVVSYLENLDREPLRSLFSAWHRDRPGCAAFALLPEAEAGKVPLLQQICGEIGLPLVGAIFPELVKDGHFLRQGAWLLPLNKESSFGMVSVAGLSAEKAGKDIAAAVLARLDAERRTLFLVFDSMVPVIGSTLDSLYLELANRVIYAGVNAGSETFQPMPCLFDGERVIGDGVLWLLLPDGQGAALEHGYSAPDRLMIASATEGNRIISINWRPAFEVYRELMAAEYGVELSRANFYSYACHFPFGILLASGDVVVRIPVALQEDGSLLCVGEIPGNALLVVLQAPLGGTAPFVEALRVDMVSRAGALGGRSLLLFYCAGRRLHLGAAAEDELASLAKMSGAGEIAGALSLGEIGNRHEWGYPLFHNAALVCRAWNPP